MIGKKQATQFPKLNKHKMPKTEIIKSMKKDIPELRVEDLAIAVVPREDTAEGNDLWDVYVINLKEEKIGKIISNNKHRFPSFSL